MKVKCSTCGHDTVFWASRVGNLGECVECLYKRYGETLPPELEEKIEKEKKI